MIKQSGIGIGNISFPMNSHSLCTFKCPECQITKNSTEDLEIHIKTEHVNWFPFRCPIPGCTACRATSTQMREHIHSHHKKTENRYIFIDNPLAKQTYQEMMDRALFEASFAVAENSQSQNLNKAIGVGRIAENGLNIGHQRTILDRGTSTKRSRLDDLLPTLVASMECPGQQQNFGTSFNSILSNKNMTMAGNGSQHNKDLDFDIGAEQIDELTSSQLSHIFGNTSVKSEFDTLSSEIPLPKQSYNSMNSLPDETDTDASHTMLRNVAALFSADKKLQPNQSCRNSSSSTLGIDWTSKRRQRKLGLSTTKRRVLGECAKCHRPVTAGARQMHIFFHLGKDHNTYRFRCKHPGCQVEHYRKDQMENHQSKIHGKIEPEMMEDRSSELYNLCQKMSMELLGTTGNTPGPSAEKAQAMYESLQKTAEMNASRKRKRPGLSGIFPSKIFDTAKSVIERMSDNKTNDDNGIISLEEAQSPTSAEDLECLLCHKYIMSRIRGFHILWHLNNDLGIIRYGCKHCDFKHDRPQSITNHGKREHNDEVSCEDLLYKYEDEVKSMSKACFGIEKIFAKEIKRRNRLEKTENEAQESGNFEVEENDLTGEELPEEDEEEKETEDLDPQDDHDHQQIYVPSNSSGTQKRKTRSMRRFGTRKPKSRKQKQEMAKLREISMHLGGGQYFKKRGSETVVCEQCGRIVNSRLSDHAYSHLDACALFKCMQCSLGHYSRETIVRHMKDLHGSVEPPIDNRLKFAKEIKRTIKECYPQYFVDSPVPTKETIDKLKATLKLSDKILTEDGDSTSDQIRGTPENDEAAGYEEDDIEGSDLDDDEHCQDDEDEQPDADEGNDDYEEFDDEDDIDK